MTDLQVNCFLEVARCLSFTQAAKNIFISQSNISRQISSLEAELGIPLFDRNTKAVKLTEQGEVLAEALQGINAEWAEAKERAKNISRRHTITISIGCQENIRANSYLSHLLYEFKQQNPDLEIEKEKVEQSRLIEGLLNDYYDCIFAAAHNIKILRNISHTTLYEDEVGLVMHKSHPLYKKENISIEDMKEFPFLRYLPSPMSDEEDYLMRICKEAGFKPVIKSETESFNKFFFLTEMGDAAALMLEEAELTLNHDLRFIKLDDKLSEKFIPMQLVRKDSNNSSVLSGFFDFAAKYAKLHGHMPE